MEAACGVLDIIGSGRLIKGGARQRPISRWPQLGFRQSAKRTRCFAGYGNGACKIVTQNNGRPCCFNPYFPFSIVAGAEPRSSVCQRGSQATGRMV
jgi:hypothetical protein